MDEEQKTSSGTKGSDPGGSDPKVTQPTPEERCAELEHSWKRALADYQNLKKDVQKEREEMASFAVVRVIERFMPALDYFKMAVSSMPQLDLPAEASAKVGAWFVGIGHIEKQFEDALADLGLKKIATVGEKFDAAKHEAVGEEEVEGKEHGTIVKEVMPGYEINGKVVRPSRVITAK